MRRHSKSMDHMVVFVCGFLCIIGDNLMEVIALGHLKDHLCRSPISLFLSLLSSLGNVVAYIVEQCQALLLRFKVPNEAS